MTHKPIQEWLKGKSAEDLVLLESGGRVFFPDVIHRLKRKASATRGAEFEPVNVAVCVPRAPEKALARRDALKLAARLGIGREKGIDGLRMYAQVKSMYFGLHEQPLAVAK